MKENNRKYRNVILDVGGVLIDYRWKDMLADYGIPKDKIEELGNLIFNDPLWGELDIENISMDEVIKEYRIKYPEHADVIEWFITHGEYMHIQRPDVWEKVRQVKAAGYNIYLLSNYGSDLFEKHTKDASFMNYIDGRVVSYEIHIIKPRREIYEYLLNKYSLKAKECIFYDDREDNIEAGKRAGIDGVIITSKECIIEELDKLIRC